MKSSGTGSIPSPSALLRIAKRRWYYLVLPVLILTPLAWYAGTLMPQKFRARALVGTTPEFPGTPTLDIATDRAAAINAQEQLRAIRETLLSRPVLETVAAEFVRAPAGRQDAAIEELRSDVQVQVDTADAFYISFESDEPRKTAGIANRLAELFVERTSVLRVERLEEQDDFLDAEVERLRAQLDQQEDGLKAYKQSVAEMLPDRLATNLKQIETLQQQIQEKTDQITETEARKAAVIDEVQALEKQGGLEPKPPEKSPAQLALEDARKELKQLKTRYTAAHPDIKRLEREIQEMEASYTPPPPARRDPTPVQLRYFSLQAELRSLDPMIESYKRERESLRSELQSYERKANSSPRYETVLSEQMRDVAVTRGRYEGLLAKQQEAKLAQRAEKTTSRPMFKVLERAEVPSSPAGLPADRIAMLGLVASLGLGVLGIFVVERFDTSFETTEDLEKFSSLPVLASIPSVAMGGVKRRKNPPSSLGLEAGKPEGLDEDQLRRMRRHGVIVPSDPASVASQQYGVLALKIQKWAENNGGRVLTITSGTGEEGKSQTALNLSFALAAASEQRVLLIDCDMRLPQVHSRLGLDPVRGFGDLLASKDSDFCPYISKVGNLHVICGGTKPENPVVLLASQHARDVMARLRDEFKYIVLDAPPVIPIADSHILSGLSDGVLLVARARRTRSELLRRAVENLDTANLLGVILNDVHYADAPYAYAYRYYQRHYVGRS